MLFHTDCNTLLGKIISHRLWAQYNSRLRSYFRLQGSRIVDGRVQDRGRGAAELHELCHVEIACMI